MDSYRSQQRLEGPEQLKTPRTPHTNQVCFTPTHLVLGLFKGRNQGNLSVVHGWGQYGEELAHTRW